MPRSELAKATACKFPGCGEPVESRGVCVGHYQHVRRKQPLRALRGAEKLVQLSPHRVTVAERAALGRAAAAAKLSVYELTRRWVRERLKAWL